MASIVKVDKIAQASGTPEFTIPTTDGAANTFLKTDGSGVLSFGAVTTTALTGSTNTWIPTITGANALTGTANFTYDGNTLDVKNSGTASSLNLYCETSNAHYIKIKSGPHASATSYTLTMPNAPPSVSGQALTATTAGVASWAEAGGGKLLQVVQGTVLDDTQSTTSATFVDMSPSLTATITPAATTSKILVNFVVTTGANEGWHAFYRILRGATPIGIGVVNGSRKQATMEVSTGAIAIATPGSMTYQDSPSTTSATAYKIQWATESGGTIYLNRSHTWTDSSNWMTGISTITLMEIGA